MKAKTFDQNFDKNRDIIGDLDSSRARRPNQEQRRVNVDFPTWTIESFDKEVRHLGVTRQSIINGLACRIPRENSVGPLVGAVEI